MDAFVDEIEADSDRPWRPASSGPSFVYVLPCFGEDLAKIGMSRDPLDRAQTLHPRWFDFFDLDDGLLVQTDSVQEARALELRLARAHALHSAPAPLTVSPLAGGHTEWFRGLASELTHIAGVQRGLGHVVHQPLRAWFRHALEQRGPLLFHWTGLMLTSIEDARHLERQAARDAPSFDGETVCFAASPRERTLRNALDAFAALALPTQALVPAAVHAWWQALPGRPDQR